VRRPVEVPAATTVDDVLAVMRNKGPQQTSSDPLAAKLNHLTLVDSAAVRTISADEVGRPWVRVRGPFTAYGGTQDGFNKRRWIEIGRLLLIKRVGIAR
jgi:hypothetical protein